MLAATGPAAAPVDAGQRVRPRTTGAGGRYVVMRSATAGRIREACRAGQ
jgi:hypothetical protein